MYSWEGVSEFVAVAEAASFTAAANRLGISTAQVSRQIRALETRLAVKLFYRTTRKVTITDAGQIYYNHCRQVLDGLAEAERAVSDLQKTPKGRLNLTAPVTYGESRIAPLVNDFIVRYPELEVNLTLTNQMLDLVAESYDLAIRLGELEDSSMMAKRLASRTHYVCASPGYLSIHGTPHTLSELEQHICLQGTVGYWRFQEEGKPRHIRVTGNLRCNSGWALVDAAGKGLGIIQLPDYYVQDEIRAQRLVPLLDAYRAPDDGIWALYPQNRHLSPKVRLLLDHLGQGLS
ncbi:HTH-type transcriptional regulator, lysR family (plasmid) [Phaeobacter piscinae]|uniref:HTH-type transcriptional regulator, lysR family n=1 Tax=Phaeobacter piscinae TaxID=1580596 RepID=A0ABN5DKX7_9RHOB|nr:MULTISPECIES: LysR substrate-binding domain-containing protein [Phaeobacter]ATG38126.1 HTH-type transcriptional regulator, lysR family [Phaeobacter piscinae]AUQ88647.1 HTH-type transcriptional regulator, lysR family [Phaeobacter piscinae]AUQ92646.1 HTH-type transcriptional regulator, lysR family [Phaeobacter inhibens]AUR26452.1 HTH-type transcriptional regulator, lysR family [Phaeobacter piscinae]